METVIRISVLYVALLAAFRVLGKRELGKLSPFELVTLMLIPEILSEALSAPDKSVTNGLIGTTTILCLVFVTSVLSYRFPWFQRVVEDDPTLLVRHGKLLHDNLNRERVAVEELFAEMHKSGFEELGDVKWAILEEDGKISVIGHSRPVTPQHRPDEDAQAS